MTTSEAAAAQSGVQAQGAELPARCRAAAPLHGDHRRRRDLPDRRPGLQDVPGDARHLEGHPVDGLVDPATRAGAAGAVRATAIGSSCGASSASASCWCCRSARVGILHHAQGGGAALQDLQPVRRACATTGWARRRPSCARATSCRSSTRRSARCTRRCASASRTTSGCWASAVAAHRGERRAAAAGASQRALDELRQLQQAQGRQPGGAATGEPRTEQRASAAAALADRAGRRGIRLRLTAAAASARR